MPGMSALGQKQTYAVHKLMSALPPIATAKADLPQTVMSALPLKADMCRARAHVWYGPEADIAALFNHPIRAEGRASAPSTRLSSLRK
jgi:hypothetical protein